MARFTRRWAYSGYFIGMSTFSSLLDAVLSSGISLSRKVICWAERSVTMVEMMHVKSIIITTPLSISSVTSGTPGSTSIFIPTISMAMAPAACADVRPNIILPDDTGRRNSQLAR